MEQGTRLEQPHTWHFDRVLLHSALLSSQVLQAHRFCLHRGVLGGRQGGVRANNQHPQPDPQDDLQGAEPGLAQNKRDRSARRLSCKGSPNNSELGAITRASKTGEKGKRQLSCVWMQRHKARASDAGSCRKDTSCIRRKRTGHRNRKTHAVDRSPAAEPRCLLLPAATLERHEIRPG